MKNNSLAGRRILIAEDESMIALDLETALQEFGCEVISTVTRVGDVMSSISKHKPDGALLDVNLRGERIFGILPEVLASGLPVIITSGYDDATLFPEEFRDLPRVAKPVDPAILHGLCVRVFGNS